MSETLRFGIIATGGIAATVGDDIQRVPGAEVVAVSSRRLERAEAFAAEHGVPRAYAGSAALLADPEVDAVYVATPHSQHHAQALAALRAGKHVLCEKPMTLTEAATTDLVRVAREAQRFLLEAMWTRFNPLIARMQGLIGEDAIGAVRSLHADIGFPVPFEPSHRIWDPVQGGGVILDMGIYPVALAHGLLGEPETVVGRGVIAANGVEGEVGLLLGFPGGEHALLGATVLGLPAVTATVVGERGRIELGAPFFRPQALTLHRRGAEAERFEQTPELGGRGYTYMVRAMLDRVRAGALECPEMPHAESIAVARTLDRALDAVGVGERLREAV